ncbi:hypothetical protein RJ641_020449, partial [Dillenia turbinata]
ITIFGFHIVENGREWSSPERMTNSEKIDNGKDNERTMLLYSAWSALLNGSANWDNEYVRKQLNRSGMPKGPHLENCKLNVLTKVCLDSRSENGSFPPWMMRKHSPDRYPSSRDGTILEGVYPPWIRGSDEENYPFTRKVQHDIWINQHPSNCSDPNVKFLVADWERQPNYGFGAQLVAMTGLLAIAIKEKRVLVTNYYNRADHDGCQGPDHARWSCYFFPETSPECRDRAFELMQRREAWEEGTVIGKENYTSREMWAAKIPRIWGEPWSYMQPTTEINGSLLFYHHKMDRRWWRAQAVRYLIRFQTDYTCSLLNAARHAAFGWEAARMVLAVPEDVRNEPRSEIEDIVWSDHRPWMPRPLLSMHVRIGDKAGEMKVVEFEEYMHLANRIRQQFPQVRSIWLSTEMQEVIEKTSLYPKWNFYYTKVSRQVGNMSMAAYEASLGRKTSTNYPLVNFLMASEADFFVGALGSTWSFLVDCMRNTGGKVMAGYLSVNKDRFW